MPSLDDYYLCPICHRVYTRHGAYDLSGISFEKNSYASARESIAIRLRGEAEELDCVKCHNRKHKHQSIPF